MSYYLLFLDCSASNYNFAISNQMERYEPILDVPVSQISQNSCICLYRIKKSSCPNERSEQTCTEDKSTIWSLRTAQTSVPDRIAADQMHDGTLVH